MLIDSRGTRRLQYNRLSVGLVCVFPTAGIDATTSTITDRSRQKVGGATWAAGGSPTLVTMNRGQGVSVATTSTYTGSAVTGWSTEISVMMNLIPNSSSSFFDTALKFCGIMFGKDSTSHLAIGSSSGAGSTASGNTVLTNGTEYVVGFRYRTSDNKVGFFLNGAADGTPTSSALTAANEAPRIPGVGGGGANPLTCKISDLRVWAAYLDDSAFKQFYDDPYSSFYDSYDLTRVHQRIVPLNLQLVQLPPSFII